MWTPDSFLSQLELGENLYWLYTALWFSLSLSSTPSLNLSIYLSIYLSAFLSIEITAYHTCILNQLFKRILFPLNKFVGTEWHHPFKLQKQGFTCDFFVIQSALLWTLWTKLSPVTYRHNEGVFSHLFFNVFFFFFIFAILFFLSLSQNITPMPYCTLNYRIGKFTPISYHQLILNSVARRR